MIIIFHTGFSITDKLYMCIFLKQQLMTYMNNKTRQLDNNIV